MKTRLKIEIEVEYDQIGNGKIERVNLYRDLQETCELLYKGSVKHISITQQNIDKNGG